MNSRLLKEHELCLSPENLRDILMEDFDYTVEVGRVPSSTSNDLFDDTADARFKDEVK